MAGSGAATEEVADSSAPRKDLRSEGAGRSALGPADEGLDRGGRGPAFTVTLCVGRLIEVRIFHLSALDTISRLSHRIATEADARPSAILGDYRRTRPFSQSVGDAWSRAMRGFNESVAWSAILLAPIERDVQPAGRAGGAMRGQPGPPPVLRRARASRLGSATLTAAELMRPTRSSRDWHLAPGEAPRSCSTGLRPRSNTRSSATSLAPSKTIDPASLVDAPSPAPSVWPETDTPSRARPGSTRASLAKPSALRARRCRAATHTPGRRRGWRPTPPPRRATPRGGACRAYAAPRTSSARSSARCRPCPAESRSEESGRRRSSTR